MPGGFVDVFRWHLGWLSSTTEAHVGMFPGDTAWTQQGPGDTEWTQDGPGKVSVTQQGPGKVTFTPKTSSG